MRIDVYLDGKDYPYTSLTPPEKFQLDSSTLSDGQHQLRFVVVEDEQITGERTVRCKVQNGPSIAVHGLLDGDTVNGEISVLANAYSSKIGDDFEPLRIESPVPIPTWAWVLFLSVLAWGAGYVSQELHARRGGSSSIISVVANTGNASTSAARAPKATAGGDLGQQIYGNNCSSCHPANGTGLASVFPPLKGNSTVLNEDPRDHIKTILEGLSNKVIDGVNYASPMPPFASSLSGEDVAAVVNHERTQWGNAAPTVSADEVKALRN